MKRIICLILAFVMLFSMTALVDSQKNAQMLKELNLFKGTDKGFELEREASRVEAIVTVVRVLGGEAEALEKNYSHKRGIEYAEILLPENAPEEFKDRNTLWNSVEEVEKQYKIPF